MKARIWKPILAFLIVVAAVFGGTQTANAAYTFILYQYGNGASGQWYFSGTKQGIAGGFGGTDDAQAIVKVNTQSGSYLYATSTGPSNTTLNHATVNNYQSACRYSQGVGAPGSMVGFNCQWKAFY